jgi:5-bromo-4-chloroindolyl phosphate hydrolysis protein
MRLTGEQVKELSENYKEYMSQSDFYDNDANLMYGNLLDTTEALQQEIVNLRAELEVTKCIVNEQTEAAIDCQQENERLNMEKRIMKGFRNDAFKYYQQVQQLQAQNATMRDVLEKARERLERYVKIYGSIGSAATIEEIGEVLEMVEKAGGEK